MESKSTPWSPLGDSPMMLGVHTLSEAVFCPRAGVLAHGSPSDDGMAEPESGPKLNWPGDLDEHRISEELQVAWGELLYRVSKLLTAVVATFILRRFLGSLWASPLGFLIATPFLLVTAYFLSESWEGMRRLFRIWRLLAVVRGTEPLQVNLSPDRETPVNWWALRKAGFDCSRPGRKLVNHGEALAGNPWRILTKAESALRIPVVVKKHDSGTLGDQHRVRIAAYCHLIETTEGGRAPFGIVLFANSYQGRIVPNNNAARLKMHHAVEETRELLQLQGKTNVTAAKPKESCCFGCPHGKPRSFSEDSLTIIGGIRYEPLLVSGWDGRKRHSTCADVFRETPPHADAIRLGMVKPHG